jgi:hypothetical protein
MLRGTMPIVSCAGALASASGWFVKTTLPTILAVKIGKLGKIGIFTCGRIHSMF